MLYLIANFNGHSVMLVNQVHRGVFKKQLVWRCRIGLSEVISAGRSEKHVLRSPFDPPKWRVLNFYKKISCRRLFTILTLLNFYKNLLFT